MKIAFCCSGLEWAITEPDGIGVLVRDGAKPWLSLYAASPDGRFHATTGMAFCPFCGADVRALVDAHLDGFRELAKKHASRLPPDW